MITTNTSARPSTIMNPADPVWSCCRKSPGGVVKFDDGTAMIACKSCLSTVNPDRRFPLPPRKNAFYATKENLNDMRLAIGRAGYIVTGSSPCTFRNNKGEVVDGYAIFYTKRTVF